MPRDRDTFKIVVLGDESVHGVGKTALVGMADNGQFVVDHIKTESPELTEILTAVDKHNCRLLVWDTESSIAKKSYQNELSQWMEGAHAVILAYSVTSQRSFTKAKVINDLVVQLDPDLPRVLVGNKIDAVEARRVSYSEGRWACRELGCCEFFEVSAKTGTDVQKPFHHLVRVLRMASNPLLVPGVLVPRPLSLAAIQQVAIQHAAILPLRRDARRRLRRENRRLGGHRGLPPTTPPPSPTPVHINNAAMQVNSVIERQGPGTVVMPGPFMTSAPPMRAEPIMEYVPIAPPSRIVRPGPFFTQEGSIMQADSSESVARADSFGKTVSTHATASVETFHSVFEHDDDGERANWRCCSLCMLWALIRNAIAGVWAVTFGAVARACASTAGAATKIWKSTRRTFTGAWEDVVIAYIDFLVWVVVEAGRRGIPIPYSFIIRIPPFRFPSFGFSSSGGGDNREASNNREAGNSGEAANSRETIASQDATHHQDATNNQTGGFYQMGTNSQIGTDYAVEMV